MQITTVRYRRLQSHDRGYGHDAVEAEAQVAEDETADEAIDALKAWVHGQLRHLKQIRDLVEQEIGLMESVRSSESTLARLNQQIADGREIIRQHEKLSEVARANGLDVPAEIDALPF